MAMPNGCGEADAEDIIADHREDLKTLLRRTRRAKT